jgi:hypothetical protein
MGVKVRVGSRVLENSIKKVIKTIKRPNQMTDEIGEFVVKRVKGFGQRGKPLNEDGSFPDLAESTIINRRRLARLNKTDRLYRPTKSNLTLTGQFWKSLKFTVSQNGIIRVFFEGPRRGYKTGKSSTQKSPPSNEELFKFLRRKGFDAFSELDARGVNGIIAIVKKFLRRELRLNNQKRR